MTLKERIALADAKKKLDRGVITKGEYELQVKKVQGIPVEPKEEAWVKVEGIVKRAFQKAKTKSQTESRPERIDTERRKKDSESEELLPD